MQNSESILSLSGDSIIEFVRDNRNEKINKLLVDHELQRFLNDRHGMKEVSTIKLEFIKRALKELSSAPLDLSHYSQAILEMRRTGAILISNSSERLFYLDIDKSIKNYLL